ncbi:MAG: ABC transporter substrate-binding protein, partial [Methanogenium sp.]|nr:ABC transporter substrate-binding protein [Methanogenium sp.]
GMNKTVPITLILGDDESTREGGQKAVSKLITHDNVDVLVGGFSSAVVSAHQSIVAEYKVPYIITGASSPVITRRTDIDTSDMFHHAPTCDASARQTTLFINDTIRPAVNAKFDFASDRPLRLAILYQDSPYGKGVESAIENTIATENLNILVVDKQSFRMGESDFRTVLTAIKAAKPDAVYAATFLNEQIPLVLQARRDVGLDTIFLAVECNDDPDYYAGVGKSGEYSIIQSRFGPYAIPQGDIASGIINFKNNFESKWGGFPGMMGASTYEGIFIAAQAVEDAGTLNKEKISDAIAVIEMPQIVETMQNQTIMFTSDYRESQFELYMEQLFWDNDINEL